MLHEGSLLWIWAQSGMASKRLAPPASNDARKRQALSDALAAAGQYVPKNALGKALISLHESGFLDRELLRANDGDEVLAERTVRERFQEAAAQHGLTDTPYGQILQDMTLETTDGPLQWKYVNPFAFLHHVCNISKTFGAVLLDHLAGRRTNIIFYFDETQPGNILRPDKARSFMAVYWTFRELPEYLRHRIIGWFPFGFMKESNMAKLPGGASNLAARVLRIFFSSNGFSFETGCRCIVDGNDVYITATFAGFLCDEKGLKQVLDVKGASGHKPCCYCKNLCGRKAAIPENHDYFVGLDCCSHYKLDLHSDDTFWQMVDALKARRPRVTRKEFEQLQQVFRVNWCDDGLLFQDDLRQVVKPATGVFWDWMHVLVSHGQADVELGLFAQAMVSKGVRIAELDGFVQQFKGLHQQRGGFKKDFVNKRLKGDGTAFSGFSGELLDLLPLVQLFCNMVLRPSGILTSHIQCFELLCTIVNLMSLGDEVLNHIQFLRRTVEQHHRKFVRVYGGECCTPKFHYMLHLADVLERLQINVSCFVTERKHRLSKAIASRLFDKFEAVLLSDFIHHTCKQFASETSLQLESVEKDLPLKDKNLVHAFKERFPTMTAVFASSAATLVVGRVQRNDMVLLQMEAAFYIGKATGFFKMLLDGSAVQFMAHVLLYEEFSKRKWRPKPEQTLVVPTSCIKATVPYATSSGDEIFIVEPSWMQFR